MNTILDLLKSYSGFIMIGLILIVVILFIMILVLFKGLNSLEKRYKKILRGTDSKNLEELLQSYLNKTEKVEIENSKVLAKYDEIIEKLKRCLQKNSIIRYKAFEDVGSDLSYSIALLDDNNDGIIITGLYGRNESITYAKPVDKGISRYDLSEEEQQVLDDAMNKGKKGITK